MRRRGDKECLHLGGQHLSSQPGKARKGMWVQAWKTILQVQQLCPGRLVC